MKITKWLATRNGQLIFAAMITVFVYIAILKSPKLLVVPILLGFVPLLLYKGFSRPYIFCLGFFVFGVFRMHEVFPILNPFKLIFIFSALGVLSVVGNLLLNRIEFYWRTEMTWFVVFFLFITVGVIFAYDITIAFEYWKGFCRIFIVFFMIIWSFENRKEFSSLMTVMVLCGVIISLQSIYNKIYGIGLIEGTRVGLGGKLSQLGDPNDLALILLIPFGFSCSALFTVSKQVSVKIAGFLSSTVILQGIIATQSRGGLLGLASILIYLISTRVKSKLPIIIVCIVLPIILYTVSHIGHRSSGGAEQGLDDSFMGRVYAWQAALNMALHHPIFGVGLNGFSSNYFQYHIFWDKTNHAVHSSWFGVLAEAGFVGLFLFIYGIYLAGKSVRINMQKIEKMDEKTIPEKTVYHIYANGIFASLIGFCVSSTFLTQGFNWPFYVIFALSITLTHSLEKLLIKDDQKIL